MRRCRCGHATTADGATIVASNRAPNLRGNGAPPATCADYRLYCDDFAAHYALQLVGALSNPAPGGFASNGSVDPGPTPLEAELRVGSGGDARAAAAAAASTVLVGHSLGGGAHASDVC